MKYTKTGMRRGSVFAGTITTDLELVDDAGAREINTWRGVNGEVERIDDKGIVRYPWFHDVAMMRRDGYRVVAS